MSTFVRQEKCGNLTVTLEYDPDPLNPRTEYDCHVGTMVCWHRRYNLGDEQPKCSGPEFMRNLAADAVSANDADLIPDEHVQRILDKHFVILPLYLYDHGGITMSTGRFSCHWDSGQVGWIYCTMKRARKEWTGTDDEIRDQALNCLEAEVKSYDAYLTGRIYGYVIEDEDGENIDSCWGFDDEKYAWQEAMDSAQRSLSQTGGVQ